MEQRVQVANPWLETFRLLAHATAAEAIDWQALVQHAAAALTALPHCPAALVWLWGETPHLAVRVVAPDWLSARSQAAVLRDAVKTLPVPEVLDLTPNLSVANGPTRSGATRVLPVVVNEAIVGVVAVNEVPQTALTPIQQAGPDLIRDAMQIILRTISRLDSLARANMQAVDMLAAAQDLMTLQDTTTEGFDTVLDAMATGLHLSHGLLLWAPHGEPWRVRAVHGPGIPADILGTGPLDAVAHRESWLAGSGPPLVVDGPVLPEWGLKPCWALRFGCTHPLGGKGLVLLGVGTDMPAARVRPGDHQLAATLSALASAAFGTLAQREAARRTSIQAVQALAQAVDAKDHYTHMHSRSVSNLAAGVAKRMGLPPDMVERTRLAGLLHDVGKIGIPDAILNKPGPLDPAETLQMRQHAALGDHITKTVDALKSVAPLVRAHHENWDGSGYPDRLAGDAIPLEARIVSAADAYDAMTTDRVYRPGRPVLAATEELVRHRGTQFDPRVVDVLVAYIQERMGGERQVAAPESAA